VYRKKAGRGRVVSPVDVLSGVEMVRLWHSCLILAAQIFQYLELNADKTKYMVMSRD